jgi:hypothetical protein
MAENSRSVTGRKGMTVAPSPLNEVKLELAIILVVGVLLLLAQGRIVDSLFVQLLVLVSYGVLGMLWIIVRARQVLRQIARDQEPHPDGPH